MNIDILTPEDSIYTGEVSLVQLPGSDGSFEILNDHAPIIASLKEGKVKLIDKNNETKFFPIKGGIVEVLNNKIIILTK
jgi:F-type H+-transporting ATPase subunit epsilon